jgi:hypothetical protein
LYEETTVASYSHPTIPPANVQPLEDPTVPVLKEFEIAHLSIPKPEENEPAIPPSPCRPETLPEKEDPLMFGPNASHVPLSSPKYPAKPPTLLLPDTVTDDCELEIAPIFTQPTKDPVYGSLPSLG